MNDDKKEHTCTICSNKGEWSKDWSCYGSHLLQECIPEDIIFVCSDKCAAELDEKLHTGEIVVTELRASGYNDFRIIKNRRGY